MAGPVFAARLAVALALAASAAAAQSRVEFPSTDAALTGGAPTMPAGLLSIPPGAAPFPAIVMAHGDPAARGDSIRRVVSWFDRHLRR